MEKIKKTSPDQARHAVMSIIVFVIVAATLGGVYLVLEANRIENGDSKPTDQTQDESVFEIEVLQPSEEPSDTNRPAVTR